MRNESLDRSNEIDEICDEFERLWPEEPTSDISAILAVHPQVDRQRLFRELLLIELELRTKRSESPQPAQYQERYPEFTEVISELFDGSSSQITEFFSDSKIEPEHTLDDTSNSKSTTRAFGDYELLKEIARGGMGVVYRARQRSLDRIVALKMIRSGELASVNEVRRFQAEAQAAARLDHPNIVPIYEVGEQDGLNFFSMGFVEGESLQSRLKEGPVSPKNAAELTRDLAEAVEYAHAMGIIHRDIKPANVLLAPGDNRAVRDGTEQASDSTTTSFATESNLRSAIHSGDSRRKPVPKITDFGLAKNTFQDSGLTATGQVMGTPSYMPPEQASGRVAEIGVAADVYSLGAVLYAMLTGRPPFQAASMRETLNQVIERDPVAPRQLSPNLDKDLETICLKCLEKDPENRYTTAADLAEDLTRYLDGLPILARPIGRVSQTWRWCKRKPLAATFVVLLLLLSVVSPIVAWNQNRLSGEARRARDRADEKVDELNRANQDLKEALVREQAAEKLAKARQEIAHLGQVQEYSAQISAALAAWETNNLPLMLHHLKNCQPELRGWEHACLSKLPFQNQETVDNNNGRIRCVAISNDDERIAVGCRNGTITIRSADTGRSMFHWNAHSTAVRTVAFDQSGNRLLSVGLDGTCCLWNAADGKRTQEFSTDDIACAEFTADGSKVIAGTVRGEIVAWKVADGMESGRWRIADARISASAIGRAGQHAVFALANGSLIVWDSKNHRQLAKLSGHRCWVNCVAINPTNRLIASGADDGSVRIWSIEHRSEIIELRGHSSFVESLKFVDNGGKLATTSSDATARIWDVKTGRELHTFIGHAGPVFGIAEWKASNTIVTGGADGQLKRWRLSGFQGPRIARKHSKRVSAVRFSNRGDRIVTASWDRSARIFDPRTGRNVRSPLQLPRGAFNSAFFGAGGKMIYAADALGAMSTASVSDVPGQKRKTVHPPGFFSATVSRDGNTICSAGIDGIKVWEPVSFKLLKQLPGHQLAVHQIAMHPNGKVVATASADATILISDIDSEKRLVTLVGHRGDVNDVCFMPNGSQVVSAGSDGTVRIWKWQSGQQQKTMRGHIGAVHSVAVMPNGRRIISGGKDNTVRIWDAETGTLLLTLRSRKRISPGASLTVSRDGHMIASGGWGGSVSIWDSKPIVVSGRAGEWKTAGSLRNVSLDRNIDFELGSIAGELQRELIARRNDSDSKKSKVYANLGTLLAQHDRLARAEHYWQKYREHAPVQNVGRRRLGSVLLRAGKTKAGTSLLHDYAGRTLINLYRRSPRSLTGIVAGAVFSRLQRGFPESLDAEKSGTTPPKGVLFDGKLTFAVVPSLYFNGRSPLTLEAIVSPRGRPNSSWATVVGTVDDGGTTLSTSSTSTKLWRFGVHTSRVGFHQYESYTRAFADRAWVPSRTYHLAGVWDGRELRLYVNGRLQASRPKVESCTRLSGFPFFIGADPSVYRVAQGFFNGRIFSVRISRAAVYNRPFSPPQRLTKKAGTIALYEFRESTKAFVPDLSGHRHHAHLFRFRVKRKSTD